MYKRRIKKYLVLLLLWPTLLSSIQANDYKRIIGRVQAGDTGKPLAFTRLSVGNNKLGTLSNEKGVFVIKVPSYLQNDTLQVSHLNYIPQNIPLESVGTDSLIVTLLHDTLTLATIEIPSITPEDTIRKSWKLRGKNYSTRPTLIQGYYQQEMVGVEPQTQFLITEGVLEIYKTPYNRNRNDKVRALKGRKKLAPRGYIYKGQEYPLPYISQGPHLGIILDVMKDDNSFLKPYNQKYYRYSFEEIQKHNNRLTYIFSFAPINEDKTLAFFKGKIYIDLQSLAIVRASYVVTEAGIKLYNTNDYALKLVSREYEVNYMEYQEHWYLQDARVANQYYYPLVEGELYSNHTFLTTEIINEKIKGFPINEALSLDESFVELVDSFDEEFWGDYNVIPVQEK